MKKIFHTTNTCKGSSNPRATCFPRDTGISRGVKITSLLAICFLLTSLTVTAYGAPSLKPRLVVLTDIAPGDIEPDDMESMVRLMTYADQVEIEALITTTGWNCDP